MTALIVYVVVGVIAPRSATPPSTHLSAQDLSRGLVIQGPSPFGPSPASTSSIGPSATFSTAQPTIRVAGATTRPLTRSDVPPKLAVAMNVDKHTVAVGDMLTYEIVATNVGGQGFNGALTINTHTPTGTLRCGTTGVLNLCSTPGDYDGSSTDPNAPHANPPGVTRLVAIGPGRSVVLETVIVQIAPTAAGTTLHNHAHVDGLSSITKKAPDVATTQAVPIASSSRAPDVAVLR